MQKCIFMICRWESAVCGSIWRWRHLLSQSVMVSVEVCVFQTSSCGRTERLWGSSCWISSLHRKEKQRVSASKPGWIPPPLTFTSSQQRNHTINIQSTLCWLKKSFSIWKSSSHHWWQQRVKVLRFCFGETHMDSVIRCWGDPVRSLAEGRWDRSCQNQFVCLNDCLTDTASFFLCLHNKTSSDDTQTTTVKLPPSGRPPPTQ